MTTPPSTLVLLSELPATKPGTKVRFIGRITNYDVESGYLTLISGDSLHATSGVDSSEAGAIREETKFPLVHVDTTLVLQLALEDPRLFEEGAVVSIVGYVTGSGSGYTGAHASSKGRSLKGANGDSDAAGLRNGEETKAGTKETRVSGGGYEHCFVQAVLMWEVSEESLQRYISDAERQHHTVGDEDSNTNALSRYEDAVLERRRAMACLAAARGE